MLDIKPTKQKAPFEEAYEVTVDGVQIPPSDVHVVHGTPGPHGILIASPANTGAILRHSPVDVPPPIEVFAVEIDAEWSQYLYAVSIEWETETPPRMRFGFNYWFDTLEWMGPFSIGQMVKGFRSSAEALGLSSIEIDDDPINVFFPDYQGFTLYVAIEDESRPLQEIYDEWWPSIANLERNAELILAEEIRNDSLVTYFTFPEQVRVPCEQYLLYFVKFLEDAGVEATAELHHDAGRVLFSVTPTSGREALEKIREALDLYLHLPTAAGVEIAGFQEGDFRVQQLVANIQHLRGQLALASAVIQLKDATIEQQQIALAQRKSLLSGEILAQSWEKSSKSADKESILGGAVAITKYEGKGFEVNLPEIFRRLRAFFRGNNNQP